MAAVAAMTPPGSSQARAEDIRRLQSQLDQLKERLDFISPMLPLVNFVQDYFQKVECEASVQMMRLRNAQVIQRRPLGDADDEISNASLETVKWLHFVTDVVMTLDSERARGSVPNTGNSGFGSPPPSGPSDVPAFMLAAQANIPAALPSLPGQPARHLPGVGQTVGAEAGLANAADSRQQPLFPAGGPGVAPVRTPSSGGVQRQYNTGERPGGFLLPSSDNGALATPGRPAGTPPATGTTEHSHAGFSPEVRGVLHSASTVASGPGSAGLLLTREAAGPRPTYMVGPQIIGGSSGDFIGSKQLVRSEQLVTEPDGALAEPLSEPGTEDTSQPTELAEVAGGLVLGKGSWAAAYRQATGNRRESLRLLCMSGIVTARELSDDLTVINEEHIDECVLIASEMLQTWPLDMWARQPYEAKKFFEARLTALYQRKFGEQKG